MKMSVRHTPFARLLAGVAVTTATVLCAVGVKQWADATLRTRVIHLGPLALRLVHNPGVAFGVGASSHPVVITAVTSAISIAVAAAVLTRRIPAIGGGLLLGGAVGNVVDRVPDHLVTDYLDLGWWPTFNLADVAIVIGAALILVTSGSGGSFAARPRFATPEQRS